MPSASIRAGPRETEAADFAVESIIAHFPKKHKDLQSGRFAFLLQQRGEQGSKTGLDPVSEYMRDLRLDKQSATDEVVANYAMRALFSDMKTAREVTKHHSGVAEAIRRAFAWIREKLGIRTSEVDRAAAMWNKAYNESRRNASGAVDLAERMAGYHADRIAEAETSATVKDSRAIDNRPPKDYNAFDEALDRRQWAQLYAEVERRESEGQIEAGANYYFTESGTPKLTIFRYDASAKNKTEVVAAYKSSSALNDAIINLKEIYENESGNFMPELHRLAESGELQQYNVRVRNYQYAPVPNRGASGVSGQSSRIGADGNAGERTSQNDVGHGSRVAGTNEITNKADSAESAFSIGGVKNSIAQNEWQSFELSDDYKRVRKEDHHAFLRSLANKTSGMRSGETRRFMIIGANNVYFFEADGYMSGSIVDISAAATDYHSYRAKEANIVAKRRTDIGSRRADHADVLLFSDIGGQSGALSVPANGSSANRNGEVFTEPSRRVAGRDYGETRGNSETEKAAIDKLIRDLKKKYNIGEADSAESAFSVGEVKDSTSLSDCARRHKKSKPAGLDFYGCGGRI